MKSKELLAHASRVAPGGVNSCRRMTQPPLCLSGGRGATVTDVDGREYLDYHAAYGAIVLGHAHPHVVERVTKAIRGDDLAGVGTTPGEVLLAERLVEHVPSFDQVLLCNSGSEATMHAVRLARAVTGRERILKFQGCYHGFHDYLLRNSLDPCVDGRGDALDPDVSVGILQAAHDATVVCRYNDLESVRRAFAAYAGQIAAVVVEPFGHNLPGVAPVAGFLEGLRSIADEDRALLVFDEVIAGIRHGLGGYQAVCGVTPDLCTLAKALGNGFPIGAVGGRRALMEQYNTHPDGRVFFAGTYNGGAAAVAAALATLDTLAEPGAYEHLFRLGARMREGLARIFEEQGLDFHVGGFGSLFQVCFAPPPIRSFDDARRHDSELFLEYRRQMLSRGVLESMNVNAMRSHVSLSHTDADVERTLEASSEAISEALRKRRAAVAA